MWLRQSTASQEILLGPFLDSTDGNTQETGLTIANTDIKIWKEGGTTEANKNSGGATHIANGRYYAVLDATDTNTLGKLEVNVHVTGALAVRREFMVLPAMVYDSLVLGTDTLDVQVTGIGANVITSTSINADAITDAKVASDVTIASVTGSVGSVTGAVGSVTGAVGSVTGNVGGNVVGSVGTVNALAANVITAAATAVDFTTEIQSGLATATELAKVPKSDGTATWNATALASINTQADLAISDAALATAANLATAQTSINDLPTNAELATALALSDDAVLAAVATVDTVVDAIKVKTDQLTYTKTNELDTNVQSINGVTINGDGSGVPMGV